MDVREKLVELLCKAIGDAVTSTPEGKEVLSLDDMAHCLIANGVTVREWVSVKERLPDVGSIVLVSDNETDCHIWQYTNYSERGVAVPWMDEFGIPCKTEEITHWMPLPDAPEVKND